MRSRSGTEGRQRAFARGLVGAVLFHVVWALATWGNGVTDIPGPLLAYRGLVQLAVAGVLWRNLAASLFRVTWGFCLAAGLGIPLGVLMGWNGRVRQGVNAVVQLLRPISPIAWLPFATVLFGGVTLRAAGRTVVEASDLASVFLIFLSSFFLIVTATTSAVRSIEVKYLRAAANFGVTGVALVRHVLLPAALPQVLTGCRLALGVAWVVIVAAEMLGVTSGLGFQVNDSRNNLRFDYVAAAMIAIALTGLLLDWGLFALERASLARRGITRP